MKRKLPHRAQCPSHTYGKCLIFSNKDVQKWGRHQKKHPHDFSQMKGLPDKNGDVPDLLRQKNLQNNDQIQHYDQFPTKKPFLSQTCSLFSVGKVSIYVSIAAQLQYCGNDWADF